MTTVSGFRTAASAREQGSVAESDQPSYLREFARMCEDLWDKLAKNERRSVAVDQKSLKQDNDAQDPYKAFWFRKGLGDQVYDCGNRFHLSGTNKEPVTDKQIMRMVSAANNRKDPPWETLYMFDHKGKPDLVMAGRVQGVILQMRASGQIPPDCKIHCCVDPAAYPKNIKGLYASLTDAHREAAAPDAPAAAAPRAGFRSALQA